MTNRITPHFTWGEFEYSETARKLGIDNTIPDDVRPAIKALCVNVLEPLREMFGRPVTISSGYRSKALNKAVKGDPKSQHCKGEAADIVVSGMNGRDLMRALIESGLEFDQAITYSDKDRRNMLHVSYTTRRPNRNMKLYGGIGTYIPWEG